MREPRTTPTLPSAPRARKALLCGAAVLACIAAWSFGPPGRGQSPDRPEDPEEEIAPRQADLDELARIPPTPGPLRIQVPQLPRVPAAGKGRIALALSGNRRWCTFPDDRVVKPPTRPAPPGAPRGSRNPIYTFGYQFTIAAVERTHPEETLLLFESPVFRTAVLRQAAKLGRGHPRPPRGPEIVDPDRGTLLNLGLTQPDTPVPFWQEQYRCTTLPETIDLDLDPGLYDIYMAFDILLRSGNWAHRSVAYRTDVTVREGDTTRLEAVLNMAAAARREFDFIDSAAPVDPGSGAGRR